MYSGLNNKLSNVPTISGLANVVADQVVTDTLIVDGNDVGSIIIQVPINTANIATLQQITTGQSYASVGDTTTFANNVTLTTGKTMTADNFTGLASNSTQIAVATNTTPTTFFPTFCTTGAGQKSLLFNISGNPLSYTPSSNTLTATTFSGNATTATTATNATNATNVALFVDNTAGTYWIPFSKTTSTTSNPLFIDTTTTPLSYNPDTSTLSASNFSGNATTATTASTSTNVALTSDDTVGSYFIPFSKTTSATSNALFIDNTTTPLSYNPNTNNLTINNLSSVVAVTPSNGSSISLNGTPIGNGGNINTVCMGVNAGNATMPNNNFCFGTNAGRNLSTAGGFQSGVQNLCIGANSGSSLTFGKFNCYLGASAARFTTTGTNNTQIGAQTQTFPDNNFIGSYNTTIGSECHISVDGLSYSTAIGAGVVASTSNTVRIGRSADNTIFDGTVSMNKPLSITTNGISPTSTLSIVDSGTTNSINFLPNAGGGSYNFLTEAGDTLIMSGNSALDVADLTIAPYSSTLSGIRITPSTTFIGVGGASTTRTAGITCSGSNVGITGTLTLNNDLILTTPSTTLTQTELSYLDGVTSNIQSQFNAISTANFVTTNTVQNITANKTMYGASLLIDNGTGNNTTLSHVNQMLNLKNNNTNSTVSVTGVIAATSLNRIVPTDGSNPTTAQILNTTVTGDNIPNQTNTYFVSAHTYNSLEQITTLSMPSGQIQSVGPLTIGMFITSGLGTNFSNGTYVTGVVSGAIYSINQPALNTTLFKAGVNFSLITTNITLSAAVSSGTINFNNFGRFQFLTNNGGGNQIMPLSIDASKIAINVPLHVNNTATFFDAVNFTQNNITLGSGNVVNLGSGAGDKLTNLVCGLTNARSIVFGTGGNTVLGGDAGNNLSTVAANNTLVGYSAGRSITSTGNLNVCLGKDSGRGITTGIQNTFVGALSGNQASGTGSNNVAVGYGAGDSMTTTASQNTLIGVVAGDAITTGNANTIVGFSAGTGLLTGINNTIIGIEAGDNIQGNYNICIGSGSSVPTAAGGNQIAIGTATETMFIQGGFNWCFGGVITNSTNGNLSGVTMGQYYTVTMASGSQTITLPNPAAAVNLGRTVTFKRKQNTTVFTLTSTGAAGFLPIGSITLSASPHSVAATVFQLTLVADGLNWAIINQQ